jgi:hypothetical protein
VEAGSNGDLMARRLVAPVKNGRRNGNPSIRPRSKAGRVAAAEPLAMTPPDRNPSSDAGTAPTLVNVTVPRAEIDRRRQRAAYERLLATSGRAQTATGHERLVCVTRRNLIILGIAAVLLGVVAGIGLGTAARSASSGLGPEWLGAGLAVIGLLVVAIGSSIYGEEYLAGLWLVSTLAPGIAAAATVFAYFVLPAIPPTFAERAVVLYLGGGVTLVAVSCAAFLGRSLARRDRAQIRMYDRLRDRYSQLRDRYLELVTASDPQGRGEQYRTMLAEAQSRLVAVRRELCDDETGRPALRWALATGYSNILRTLHRVEEMIIAAQPDPAVIGDALHDSMSLSESTIAGREDLGIHLASAMRIISPPSAATFFTPRAGPSVAKLSDAPSAAEAREVLREVRFAVNEFRDDRIDGLIRARNRLVWAVIGVAVFVHVLLSIAILFGVSKEVIAAAAVFYLVGAVVGLFNRLRIESGRSSAVEDYGLYLARLVTVPMLAGLAGVLGVYIVAKTPQFLAALTPGTEPTTLPMADVYNLGKNELGVLVAAVFGLLPAQVVTALQRNAERFQFELEKSEPAGGSSLPSTGGDR